MHKPAIALGLALLAAQPALSFGTVHGAGQDAEHERITRHALACGVAGAVENCFEPKSLQELAGGHGDFGAIGIPDRGDLLLENRAHCDSGDYFDVPGYPQSRAEAQAALVACRDWMREKLGEAVRDSAVLLSEDRTAMRPGQVSQSCVFVGQIKGKAKCNVIEDLGILLHAAQDFYSHSNWVGTPDPAMAVNVDNPPGLGNTGRAPWLDLRIEDPPFPDGLISGCFQNLPEATHCNYGPGNSLHRVKHAVLNKDTGTIDPVPGAGTTPRGRIDDNFARAVDAAIDDTRDKWAEYREHLNEEFGPVDGNRIACIVSHDDPARDCSN